MAPSDDDNGRVDWLKTDLEAIKRQLDSFVRLYGETRETIGKHDVRISDTQKDVDIMARRFHRLAIPALILLLAAVVGVYVK